MRGILSIILPLVLAAVLPAVEFMPADARWNIRLDVRAVQAAGVLDACQDATTYPQQVGDLVAFEGLSGLRLQRDLDALIVCGTDAQPENNLAIVHGRFDAAKLLALAQTMPDYHAVAGDGPAIHQWTTARKRTVVACLAREDVLLLGASVGRIRAALAAGAPAGPVVNGKGLLASGFAKDLEDWSGIGTGAKELAHIERMSAHIALRAATIELTAAVHAGNWVRAKQLVLLARSGLRIIRMVGKLDPALLAALGGAAISSTGPDVDIVVQLPLKEAQRLLLIYLDKDIRPIVVK